MRIFFSIIIWLAGFHLLYGQGCSDAGACSAGTLGLGEETQANTDMILGYSQGIGLADKESFVFTSELMVSHRLFPSTNLEVRIPYLITVGNLATTAGVGDLLISLSQILHQGKNASFSAVLGGRLRTNDANKKSGEQALPMVYQSSLGTHDIIAGLAWHSEKWSLSMAYQHPFGNNLNEYLWPDSTDVPEDELYFESAYLKRGDDLMVRIQRTFNAGTSSKIIVGALPVWRLQKDEIKRDGVYEQLPGSNGITFNLYANWLHSIGENKLLSVSAGFPVHAREYRADGLTRTFIITAGLVFKFRKLVKEVKPIPGLYKNTELK